MLKDKDSSSACALQQLKISEAYYLDLMPWTHILQSSQCHEQFVQERQDVRIWPFLAMP